MTPGQITAITALATLIEKVGTWQTGSVLFLFAFLPDLIFVGLVIYVVNRQNHTVAELRKQHNDFSNKYDGNIELVKQVTKIAESLQDVVVYNTQIMQQVKDTIDNNLFCPMVRKEPRVEVRP